MSRKTREFFELIFCQLREMHEVLRSIRAPMLHPPSAPPAMIVLFGTGVIENEVRGETLSILVESTTNGLRAVFMPQELFRLEQWLLIDFSGKLMVMSVRIRNIEQGPAGTSSAGVYGRYGSGKFTTAEVGNIIEFKLH